MAITLDGTSGTLSTSPSSNISFNSAGDVVFTSNGTIVSTSSSQTGFKNRIINGAMVIDQRNAGASLTPTNGAYSLDRWQLNLSQASKFTVQQSSTAPTAFGNSLKITSSSAYSVVSTDYFALLQCIEAQNITDFCFGTANAKTVTLSFWVYSSLTGTFGGAARNYNADRSYPFSYTISSANTWEQKTVTFTGDTTGTWNTTGNSGGLFIIFSLGAGSTLSGTVNTWQAGNYIQPTGATSVVGTSGATLYITGVQLEKGSAATSFDYRDYGREFIMCQRYYINYTYTGTEAVGATLGYTMTATSGQNYHINFQYPVIMRAAPTLTYTNWANSNFPTTANFQSTGTAGSNVYKTANGSGVAWYLGGYTASAEL